jgi:hypothetical protein
MDCSFCCKPLPEGDSTVEDMPNVFVYNKHSETMLQLHAECVDTVIAGLHVGHTLVVN